MMIKRLRHIRRERYRPEYEKGVTQMTIWKWNDMELEIDMEDADFQEKYENAFEIMKEEEQKVKKIGKLSELTRSYCDMFYHLFDNIFGKGTGEKLLGAKRNSRIADDCYESFLTCCKREVQASNKSRSSRYQKFKVMSKR